MYLGFADQGMEPNKITDFLVRVIQPKLTAIAGIQRASPYPECIPDTNPPANSLSDSPTGGW